MFVCHCAVVTDRDVVASIAAGSTTLADLCRSTSAGRGCGNCVSTLKRLLCQYCPLESPTLQEVAGATR